MARFETRNSHAMVMTQVVLVLSPIPTTRCSKHDGVMRLKIYNLKLPSWPCTCQITQCRIQTLRFGGGGGGGLPQKYFRPFGPQFGLKIWAGRGSRAPPLDPLIINKKHSQFRICCPLYVMLANFQTTKGPIKIYSVKDHSLALLGMRHW